MNTIVIKSTVDFSELEYMIYDILFSNKIVFHIDLQKYCTFKTRPLFRDEIRTITKRGGIIITDDRIIHTNETVIWKIEVKR